MKLSKHGVIIAEDSIHTGTEPLWAEHDKMELPAFKRRVMNAMAFYTYYCDSGDLSGFVCEWMKKNGYGKDISEKVRKQSSRVISPTFGKIARMFLMGMPTERADYPEFKQQYYDAFVTAVKIAAYKASLIKDVVSEETPAPRKLRKTPLELISEKTLELVLGPLEDDLDKWIKDPKNIVIPNIYELLSKNGIPSQGAAMVLRYLNGILAELSEVCAGTDEQLNEAYAFLSKRDLNKLVKTYEVMVESCKKYTSDKKVTRRKRVKKPVSVTKQTSGVKFKSECNETGIKSVNPVSIPGSQYVYLYNTKYRVLTKLIAMNRDGVSVKGTTINGFNEESSYALKLRKPQEIINLFKGNLADKKIETTLGALKAKRYKARGRINCEVVILKVGV